MIKHRNFLSVCGGDGCGKTTAIPTIARTLEEMGEKVIITREPGGTPLGEQLRAMLLNEAMHIDTELMLMFAARREHLERVIEPALRDGYVIVSDRFHDSSYAFQGAGRGVPVERIEALDHWCGGVRPAHTLFFDLPLEVADARMGGRKLDRFEQENFEFRARVRNGYLQRVEQDPARFRIINANQSIEGVQLEVAETIRRLRSNP